MRVCLVAALMTSTIAIPALSADLPVKGPIGAPYIQPSWAGLYIDLYALYAANTTDADVAVNGVSIANIATSPHGPGIGGGLGYNFQVAPGALVIGGRVDAAWANINGSGSFAGALNLSNATNWLGDADLLVGLPLGDGRLLGYIVGGFAFGGAKPNLEVANVQQGVNDTATGWNIGAGLKYQLTPNWIVGIEGDYFELGDRQVAVPLSSLGPTFTAANHYHIWQQKLGVTYKF